MEANRVDWAQPERRHPGGIWLPARCRRSAGPYPIYLPL